MFRNSLQIIEHSSIIDNIQEKSNKNIAEKHCTTFCRNLIGRKTQLSLYSKLIIYKGIIKPVWTYGIQLWGAACNSNLDIIQRFQSKTMTLMLDTPWYVTNGAIHRDLEIERVKKEIERYSEHYEERLRTQPNELTTNLLNRNLVVRRLKGLCLWIYVTASNRANHRVAMKTKE